MAVDYSKVATPIIDLLDEGHIPWRRDWSRANSIPCNHESNRPYSGSNIISCWVANWARGYTSNRWLTFAAIKRLGLKFKGEAGSPENKGTPVIVYKPPMVDKKTGEVTRRAFASNGTIFNIEQLVGVTDPTDYDLKDHDPADVGDAIKVARALDVPIEQGEPSYSPIKDRINMPDLAKFTTTQAFMSVLGHECVHSTGHPSRLDREMSTDFGSTEYAYEELIAEFGAAFLCAEWGIEYSLEQHASYIQSWVKLLQDKPKALSEAASAAGKAVTFISNKLVELDIHMEHSASLADLLEYGEAYGKRA